MRTHTETDATSVYPDTLGQNGDLNMSNTAVLPVDSGLFARFIARILRGDRVHRLAVDREKGSVKVAQDVASKTRRCDATDPDATKGVKTWYTHSEF